MKWLVIIGVIILILTIGWYRVKNITLKSIDNSTSITVTPTQTLPFEAHFLIFTNGTKRIFTDPRYHNLSPDVFITSKTLNTLTISKAGITWNDFFSTLPMKVTPECLTTGTGQLFCTNQNNFLRFYLNGVENSNILNKQIHSHDRLLIHYGTDYNIQQELFELEEIHHQVLQKPTVSSQ